MSVKDWTDYLWHLLPRPYKIYELHRGDEGKTEIKKYTEALSHEMEAATESILDVRKNWFVRLMDASLLDTKGYERGRMMRFPKESDDEYRARIINAFNWFKLGGTAAGMKYILECLGYRDVRLTERVTEEEWAEFAVDVTLPYGDFLVQETIDRVERIVNEIKAAHTRLVSTNLVYDPPDIGLEPDHVHRYDYCYYDLGFWPRPVENWSTTDGDITGATRYFRETETITRFVIDLGMMYGYTRYDDMYRHHVWKHFSRRDHNGFVERTWRDRLWQDPGIWEGKSHERVAIDDKNMALRLTFAFSQGMYDGQHPMDSLNCVYGARYRFIDDCGMYGVTKYDAYIEEAGYRPIYRYYRRWTPSFGTIADAVTSKAVPTRWYFSQTNGGDTDISTVFKRERTYGKYFSAFSSRGYPWGDSRWDEYRWGDEFGVRWSPVLIRSYGSTSGDWRAKKPAHGCVVIKHPSAVIDISERVPSARINTNRAYHCGYVSSLGGGRQWRGRWNKNTWKDEGAIYVPNAYVKKEAR